MGQAIVLLIVFTICLGGMGVGVLWAIQTLTERQLGMMQKTVEQVAETVRITASEATRAVLDATMAATIGRPDTPVRQSEVGAEGDLFAPEWMKWETEHEDVDKWGAGDSVNLGDRATGDRAAMLDDGESIIPGVPLPDMTGERYEPS